MKANACLYRGRQGDCTYLLLINKILTRRLELCDNLHPFNPCNLADILLTLMKTNALTSAFGCISFGCILLQTIFNIRLLLSCSQALYKCFRCDVFIKILQSLYRKTIKIDAYFFHYSQCSQSLFFINLLYLAISFYIS